ncbi:hypothetical protein ACWEO1_06265 [Kitasatospora cineracea]
MIDDNLAAIAAKNYVLHITEASRADDDSDDLTDHPVLTTKQVTEAYQELSAGTANVTVAFGWDRRLPAVQKDGRIHYPRTQDMDIDSVNAALVALAAEHAWLTQAQAQRADEFATLLKLRARLQADNA